MASRERGTKWDERARRRRNAHLPSDTALSNEGRDHPLVLKYLPPEDFLKPLGISVTGRHGRIIEQIVAAALDKAWNSNPWVSYSRNRNHYRKRGTRYDEHAKLYTYGLIVPQIDYLTDAGLLETEIAPNDPNCGWQSMFRATSKLIDALCHISVPVAKPRPRALIQLRDEYKNPIDYEDTEQIDRMRKRIIRMNEVMSALRIELPAGVGERRGNFLMVDGSTIALDNTTLYRVFNMNFMQGGRLYGHFVQNLPKRVRKHLKVNGEPVCEPDYPSHHIRIPYALMGQQPEGDPYDIDGWDRSLVKRATMIAINAINLQSAIRAITFNQEIAYKDAERLVEQIQRKHKAIDSYFHSGAGSRLQRIDSEMAERVVLDMARRGVSAMPIHDSFVAPAKTESAVREAMAEAFDTVIARERRASPICSPLQPLNQKSSYIMVGRPLLPPCSSFVPSSCSLLFTPGCFSWLIVFSAALLLSGCLLNVGRPAFGSSFWMALSGLAFRRATRVCSAGRRRPGNWLKKYDGTKRRSVPFSTTADQRALGR